MAVMGTLLSRNAVDCGMWEGKAHLLGACVCIFEHLGKWSHLTWENEGYAASLERLTH